MKIALSIILAATLAACSSVPSHTAEERQHEKSVNIAKDILKQQQEQRERLSFLTQQKR
jgi:uncharacterized protein YceK